MLSQRLSLFAAVAFGAMAGLPLHATITLNISSSLASPQLLGTPIMWAARASDSNPNPVTYRFEIATAPYTSFAMLEDYSTAPGFTWTESYVEGQYEIRVTARDYKSGETAVVVSAPFQITSRVVNGQSVVNATTNPLVALFSAPTCPTGSTMLVTFTRMGAQISSSTDARPCHAGSQNFYIAGMVANTSYSMNYQVNTGSGSTRGPQVLTFKTGSIPAAVDLPLPKIIVPAANSADTPYKISLSDYSTPAYPYAADLQAEIVWYSVLQGQLMRTLGQTYLINGEGKGTGTGPYGVQTRQQALREMDLAGNVVRMTNADRISEQLAALGADQVARFNHDAIRLSNDHTIALMDAQRAFPAGTQGSSVPLDIIGEVVVELDSNFQVVWYWDAFDHDGGGTQLDINRAALQHETCTINPSTHTTAIGCPPALLPGFSTAQDWLHANCVQLLSDGNLMLSLRDQDWIVKIDYENSAVLDGDLLWRLGNEGDFTIVSSDTYPWFSGQHEPGFFSPTGLALFDNGNLRVAQNGGDSRGMAFAVDETNKVITTILSADLGVYASSQGSAQLLPNGDYQFQPGIVDNTYMQSLEITPNAPNTTVFNMQVQSVSYRTFRMPNMYTPPYGTAVSTISPISVR